MKKKFEDLTLKEIRDIKKRCHNYMSCEECKEKDKLCYTLCDWLVLDIIDTDILKQEIEVEEC